MAGILLWTLVIFFFGYTIPLSTTPKRAASMAESPRAYGKESNLPTQKFARFDRVS